MYKTIYKILVTGGAGFIGSAFVRKVVERGLYPVVVDKLTYAADLQRLKDVESKFTFYRASICDRQDIEQIIEKEKVQCIINFAAETHVDRSIKDSEPFLQTNILGTHTLLEVARAYGVNKFIHISTDETYGEITQGEFFENSPLFPNSPYAASKAAADFIIRSYIRTYNLGAIIVRPCNNYGPWQYPEKFIPRAILKVLRDEKIPVYGKGENVREWLYVDECAEGICDILEKGRDGEVYNLGSGQEKQNIEIAKMILKLLKKDDGMIEFVKDRPGHDLRYKLNSEKVYTEIKWSPKVSLLEGLSRTATWCLEHREWMLNKDEEINRLYSHES